MAPQDKLEAIGLKPKVHRTYELADGTELKMDITTGDLEFMGEIVGETIIFADPGTEPLLGVTALDSVGIEVDPQNHRLIRLPATRLKKFLPRRLRSIRLTSPVPLNRKQSATIVVVFNA